MSTGESAGTHLEKLLYSIRSLSEIGEELSSAEDFEKSSLAVLHLIMGTLIISKAAILLFNESTSELEVAASRGLLDTSLKLSLPREVVAALRCASEPLLVDRAGDGHLEKYFREHKEELLKLHSHIWLPLRVKSGFLGVITVSKKFMRQDYEAVDLEILSIISQQLSIGVNNFKLFRSLKESNFQLNRKLLELETLYDLGIAIGQIMEVGELCEMILFNAVGLTDAGSGMLVLRRDESEALELAAGINLTLEDSETLRANPLVTEVIESGESVLINNAGPRDFFGRSKVLLVPLRGQHAVKGAISLSDKESRAGGPQDFTEEDRRLLTNFGYQAGVAIENAKFYAEMLEKERLERELQVAATIQKNLLPATLPRIPRVQIAASTEPSRMVGGDCYDFISRDLEHLMSIADVSGKGIPAALLVSTLHATLNALVSGDWDLPGIVSRLSMSIYSSSLANKFISFFIAKLDEESLTLTSVNAGHNYPLLISEAGEVSSLQTGGMCLGLLPGSTYDHQVVNLKPGDVLTMYTDGLTESFNPDEEEYGEERLKEFLLANRRLSAEQIFEGLLDDVRRFSAGVPPHDDLTLIVIKISEE